MSITFKHQNARKVMTLSPKVDHSSYPSRYICIYWLCGGWVQSVRVFYLGGESCVNLCTALYTYQAKQRMLTNISLLMFVS